jgi:hypothetical protein
MVLVFGFQRSGFRCQVFRRRRIRPDPDRGMAILVKKNNIHQTANAEGMNSFYLLIK